METKITSMLVQRNSVYTLFTLYTIHYILILHTYDIRHTLHAEGPHALMNSHYYSTLLQLYPPATWIHSSRTPGRGRRPCAQIRAGPFVAEVCGGGVDMWGRSGGVEVEVCGVRRCAK